MNRETTLPDQAVAQLVSEISPRYDVFAIAPVTEEYANESFVLVVKTPKGLEEKFVIKRYVDHGTDRSKKARLEYNTLSLLKAHEVRVPEPVYLDADGSLFGAPTIVTRHIAGKTMWTSPDGLHCAREMAQMLARIHSIPVDGELQKLLLDGNAEALWFMKPEGIPPYMQTHPDGQMIWESIPKLISTRAEVKPVLIHLDYWMGNVLWDDMKITAVFDWEEAAYGDPAIDVGYCRMDMFLSRMGLAAADELLAVYEAEMGHRVENLSLWEYAAAPRCMHDPSWEEYRRQELRDFIAQTRKRCER